MTLAAASRRSDPALGLHAGIHRGDPVFEDFSDHGHLARQQPSADLVKEVHTDASVGQVANRAQEGPASCANRDTGGPAEQADDPAERHTDGRAQRALVCRLLNRNRTGGVFRDHRHRIDRDAPLGMQLLEGP